MTLQIRNRRDFWSGLMFTAFGTAFAVLAMDYDIGTASEMGPGWFPFALGLVLALLGLLIGLNACRKDAAVSDLDPIGWRELSLILAALGLFAFLLPRLGVVISVVELVLIAGWASHERNFKELLVIAAALVVVCYVVFIRGLGLPLSMWPAIGV